MLQTSLKWATSLGLILAACSASAARWLEPTPLDEPGRLRSLVCAAPVTLAALRENLDSWNVTPFRKVRLEYPAGSDGREADLTLGARHAFKLRRFTQTRVLGPNVISMFARPRHHEPPAVPSSLEDRLMSLNARYPVFEPLANDRRAPHVDLNDWIELRDLARWRDHLGEDFLSTVRDDLDHYRSDERNLLSWGDARLNISKAHEFAPLLRAPFVVFAVDRISVIVTTAMNRLAICVPREVEDPLPLVRATLGGWLADPAVNQMFLCEAELLR